jgi:acetyl-CoA C-acetyltransferase
MTKKKNRNVGIIGIGMTEISSHKENQNQPEMINEAVRAALADAGITLNEIDCIVHGNMELFEMVHQPDLWHMIGTGALGKPEFRITTGGTTGMTLIAASDNLVASGMYDVVMAVGFNKLQEAGSTTGGITNMADPLWYRHLQTGALTSTSANVTIAEFGEERARKAAIKHRIMMDKHASLNPRAHRRFGLEYEQMDDLMKNSPPLIGELRLIHMCSQSDGACVMIMASEEKAKEMSKKPVWIRDHIAVHREETASNAYFPILSENSHRVAARKLFARNGITNPVEYFDVFEMYDPSAWWGIEWLRDFFLLEGDQVIQMVENGDFGIDGKIPVNPSGGVTASNPISATAMLKPAEVALQMRGDAGPHQLKREVKHGLASGFGGVMWTELMILEKDLDWQEV